MHSISRSTILWTLVLCLNFAPVRRSRGEDRLDFKYMYYQEDDGRIQVLTPTVLLEKDFSSTLTIKIEGIYNAISGASPTGAPPVTQSGQPSTASSEPYSTYVTQARENEREGRAEEDDDSREGEDEDEGESGVAVSGGAEKSPQFRYLTGATQKPTPAPKPPSAPPSSSSSSSSSRNTSSSRSTSSAPAAKTAAPVASSKVPVADATDERTAFNIELIKRLNRHTVGGLASYSTEQDYESFGLAVRDAIGFNKKNTTLNLGAAYTHDLVDAFALGTTEEKDTIDAMVGVSQILDPRTLFTVNLTLSHVTGFLNDQYKVVELNGVLIPEKRPDNKDKQIVYVSLQHFFDSVQGSAELGYRFYNDTFGVRADTIDLAWYQKLGRQFILSPRLRWYQQSEADFYDVRFSGSPDSYSSDYRVAAMRSYGYGLKLIWTPSARWSLDASFERYSTEGTDNKTPEDAFPSANIVTVGARYWF